MVLIIKWKPLVALKLRHWYLNYWLILRVIQVESDDLVRIQKTNDMILSLLNANYVHSHGDTSRLHHVSVQNWNHKKHVEIFHNGNFLVSEVKFLHALWREHHAVHFESYNAFAFLQRLYINNFKLTFVSFIAFLTLAVKISFFVYANCVDSV